jgi:hypothetical protein
MISSTEREHFGADSYEVGFALTCILLASHVNAAALLHRACGHV